jgi:hypothetical protein
VIDHRILPADKNESTTDARIDAGCSTVSSRKCGPNMNADHHRVDHASNTRSAPG